MKNEGDGEDNEDAEWNYIFWFIKVVLNFLLRFYTKLKFYYEYFNIMIVY